MTYTPAETNYMPDPWNGTQKIYTFDNGYGASVVCHDGSYGGKSGMWELAVLHDGDLCYDTPITNDVIGWLDENAVEELLAKIEALDPARVATVCPTCGRL